MSLQSASDLHRGTTSYFQGRKKIIENGGKASEELKYLAWTLL
jgi:hypothetical protein